MGFDYNCAVFYDTEECLRRPLEEVEGTAVAQRCNLGSAGDLLQCDHRLWPKLDGLVSGPPCPPWSSIGARRGSSDERHAVFEKVHEIIVFQGSLGMAFFITEMVLGHDHTQRGEELSAYKTWLFRMARDAPMYLLSSFILPTQDYLPQHRERIYTLGIHKQHTALPVPMSPAMPGMRQSWARVLHPGMPTHRERSLTLQQQLNLELALHRIRRKGAWTNPVCVAADRDPLKKFGTARQDGLCCTLRTGNELCWLAWLHPAPWLGFHVGLRARWSADSCFAVWAAEDGSTSFSRALHPLERLSLQGFPCDPYARHLTKKEILVATGNAMSVPCVGAALEAVLVHLASSVGWNAFLGSAHFAAGQSRREHLDCPVPRFRGCFFALPLGLPLQHFPLRKLLSPRKADFLDRLRYEIGLAEGRRAQHEEKLLALQQQG
ncbi:ssoIIM [Symbiodinium sp. CCMP2456]|nr:ssoIIM [Symbiodinium sp. CCMP2456]